MSNEELLEKAKEAVSKLFGDMSVSKEQTVENLEEIADDISVMIESLKYSDD